MKKGLLVLSFFCYFNFCNAQAGKLDFSFGNNGIIATDIGSGISNNNMGKQVLVESDSTFYIISEIASLSRITKKRRDGTTDLIYGVSGNSETIFIYVSKAAMQNDVKIIVVGYVFIPNQQSNANQLAIARFNTNGSFDTSYNNVGISITSSGYNEFANSLAIKKDGKIVVRGYSEYVYKSTISYFSIIPLNKDGRPDNTFNGGGILHTFIFYRDYGNSLKNQNDNKMILTGYSNTARRDLFTIARFNTDGTLDNTFHNGGKVITASSSANSRIQSITILGNNLYTAGFGQYPGNFGVVAKYLLCHAKTILPMRFLSFKGEMQNKKINLNWQIENQKNLSGFVIEKSTDAITFSSMGYVAGDTNMQLKSNYFIDDIQPVKR